MEPAKQKIIIVDQNDEVVGFKERGATVKQDICRVSALWVTNSRGEILIAKRHRNKFHHPGTWGPAVAGTVEVGESYLDNIIKEAKEELGLENIKPEPGPKIKMGQHNDSFFLQWYTMTTDKKLSEFELQAEEVEGVDWISPEELEKQLKEQPEKFGPNMKRYFELFC
ncbi:MAG: NUDIX domain-containing protein [Candidatus Moranbacteria bacterium]|nr:NUDIX domain-containing protein [Candidatus Moranbacteria bacterium]